MSGRLLETLGRKLIKGWKSSFRQPAPFTSASQWEWGLLDSWDGCEWRAEGRNFPGDKAEAAHRGLGVERMKQTKNASKKKGPSQREDNGDGGGDLYCRLYMKRGDCEGRACRWGKLKKDSLMC